MLCPRCRKEWPDPAPPLCAGCGAPLRLPDEPPPLPLDALLDLDRRGPRERGGAPADPPAPARAGLAEVERSRWDLGRALAAGPSHAGPTELGPVAAAPAPERAPLAGAPLAAPDAADVPEPEVEPVEIHLRRPPTWRRALAGAVDALPFAAGALALARLFLREATVALPAPPSGVDGLLDLVARERGIVVPVAVVAALALFVYVTLGHALAGATLGKRLLGLRVVGPDGARPTLGRSAARSALAVLSAALLGTGFLLAHFMRSGRALHDLVASTWVVEAP